MTKSDLAVGAKGDARFLASTRSLGSEAEEALWPFGASWAGLRHLVEGGNVMTSGCELSFCHDLRGLQPSQARAPASYLSCRRTLAYLWPV